MRRSTGVWLIGCFWMFVETRYFGWNALPASVAELFADGLGMAFIAMALAMRNSEEP